MKKNTIQNNNKYLFCFETIQDFFETVEDNYIEQWNIYPIPIQEREKRIESNIRYEFLSNINDKTNTTNNTQEIVSWIDTMNYMYHTLQLVENLKGIQMIQELRIPYSNKRPDYLLFKDNKLLIIEFSFKKLGNEYQYENKLTQAIGYKELLSNILPNHIEIGTYTCLVNAETDEYGSEKRVKSKYEDGYVFANYDNQVDLAKYIENFFSRTKKDAITELKRILR